MKIKDFKAIPWRIKSLITRKFTWVDQVDGSETTVKEHLSTAWSMVGIHSHNWWWVKKYGRLPCGCMKNPLTRRMVLYRWKCAEHFPQSIRDENDLRSDS